MAVSGISTLGITVGYAESTDGTKPSTGYKQLTRINSIGEVSIESETIDSSALEDLVSKFVAGRGTVTDNLEIQVNFTDSTVAEWKAICGKQVCIETIIPGYDEAFFVLVTVPSQIPQPALDQNSLLVFTMSCVVNNFDVKDGFGLQTKVDFQ